MLILVGSLWFIYEMIGTKGIYLYNDRVIKRYRFRKNEKVVLLERAIYNGQSIYLKIITLSENKIPILQPSKYVRITSVLTASRKLQRFLEILARNLGEIL